MSNTTERKTNSTEKAQTHKGAAFATTERSAVGTKRNIVEKIWDTHVLKQLDGHPAVLTIDMMLLHEVTSAQAFQTLEEKGLTVFDPQSLLATIDHSIPTRKNRWEIYDEAARLQVDTLRQNCKKYNIPFLDFDSGNQGIVHVVGPEM